MDSQDLFLPFFHRFVSQLLILNYGGCMQVGINITPLHSGHKVRGIGYYTKNLLNSLKKEEDIQVVELTKILETKNIEVVHYPWFDLYYHTLPIVKSIPTVVTIHDVIPLIFPKQYPVGIKGRLSFFLQRLALNSCKFIITDSLSSKKDIIKYLKINEEKIIAIPLAADPQFKVLEDPQLLKVQRKYNLPKTFLMYVGDANWSKNLPFLIEGYRKLIQDPQFNQVKLVLVGGVFLKNVENIDHPELESLKKVNRMIKELHLENQIIRPGNIESSELVAFYNLATLYIQPSLYEGFGLPVLQAFACGTPVISSNAGSLPEIGGKATIYFDPTNIDQFISLLKGVIQDKSLRYKLSRLGLERAAKFSWEKVMQQTKEVYKKAIAS